MTSFKNTATGLHTRGVLPLQQQMLCSKTNTPLCMCLVVASWEFGNRLMCGCMYVVRANRARRCYWCRCRHTVCHHQNIWMATAAAFTFTTINALLLAVLLTPLGLSLCRYVVYELNLGTKSDALFLYTS